MLHFKRLVEVSTLTSAPATANLRDGRGSRALCGGSRHYSLGSGAVLGNNMEWGGDGSRDADHGSKVVTRCSRFRANVER